MKGRDANSIPGMHEARDLLTNLTLSPKQLDRKVRSRESPMKENHAETREGETLMERGQRQRDGVGPNPSTPEPLSLGC